MAALVVLVGPEAEAAEVVEHVRIEPAHHGARRPRGQGRQPIHLSKVVDRPRLQGNPERGCRIHGDQPVVRALQLLEGGMQPLQRPADVGGGRVTGHAEAGDLLRRGRGLVKPACRLASHVQESLVIDPQRLQQPVDPANAELREIGQGRPQVRCGNRRQAQDAARPVEVGRQKGPRVEPAHAVPNQVDRLVRELFLDLPPELFGPPSHPGDRVHARHQYAVARRPEEVRDAAEVRGKRQWTQADSRKSKQTVGQDDGSF
jgi:hypothetical protein